MKKFDFELKIEKLEEKFDEFENKYTAIGEFEQNLEKVMEKLRSKLKLGKNGSHADKEQ